MRIFIMTLFMLLILSDRYLIPEWDLNLGPSRIAVFEDCYATALTTQLDYNDSLILLFLACYITIYYLNNL